VFEFAVTHKLFDFLLRGDKIDEVHELIDESLDHIIGEYLTGVRFLNTGEDLKSILA